MMKRKRIAHLIATNFYGGPEKQIIEHLRLLENDQQLEGVLITFVEGHQQNEILSKARDLGLEHIGIPMNGPMDVRALKSLMNALKMKKIDFLCAHHYKAVVMGWFAAKRLKIPVIDYSRGFTAENKKIAFYESLERFFIKRMDGIVSVSEGQREKLELLNVQHARSWVVHNGVSIPSNGHISQASLKERYCLEFRIPNSATVCVSAGRLSPEKGHKYLVEAIAQTSFKRNNTYYIFCGDGVCQNELEELAHALDVAEFCRFVGFRKDLDEIFQMMDFLALPSLTEGLPNVILEAFSFRKTVVATSVGGVPEVVTHGENGYLVPAKESGPLADAIERVILQKKLRERMGESGYGTVKEKFSFEEQTRKLKLIYKEFLLNN